MVSRLLLFSFVPLLINSALAHAEYPHYLNVAATHDIGDSSAVKSGVRVAAVNPFVPKNTRFHRTASSLETPAAKPVSANTPPNFREENGAWIIQCWTSNEKRCEILQQHIDEKTRQQILLIGFSFSPKLKQQITMVTSSKIKASASISLLVDQQILVEAPLKGCVVTGCVHTLEVSSDQIARLSAAKNADTLIQLTDDRFAKISLNVEGLSNSLEKANKLVN